MDENKARHDLQKLIDACGQTIRDIEKRNRQRPDQPPLDCEWFRVLRAKARTCLDALNAGDLEEYRALLPELAAATDAPLCPSLARVLGLRPSDDWLGEPAEPQVLINCVDLGPGWVYIHAAKHPRSMSRLPIPLNDAFTRWCKENPDLRIRTVLPIVGLGNTVAIHVFFDRPSQVKYWEDARKLPSRGGSPGRRPGSRVGPRSGTPTGSEPRVRTNCRPGTPGASLP